jgi:hypothetical protein
MRIIALCAYINVKNQINIMKVFSSILDFLFGKKYYAVILWRASTDIFEISSRIFRNKGQVEAYKETMYGNRTYRIHAVVSFRTREPLEWQGEIKK